MEHKKGVFYAVGVGPGEPELITLKAIKTLSACPVIAAPRTPSGQMLALEIAATVLNLQDKTVLPLDFPMERQQSQRQAAYAHAADLVAEHLQQGLDVAMVNLGDVSIYATCSSVIPLLQQQGYETHMIPGVPSFCAAAARLNQPLAQQQETLHILPVSCQALEQALELKGTKVLMKSGKQLTDVIQLLEQRGQLTSARLVSDCGLPGEYVCTDLTNLPDEPGYFTTIIVKE